MYNDELRETHQKYHWLMQEILLKTYLKCMNCLYNYNKEFGKIKKWIIHYKTKRVNGEKRWY